VEIEEPGSRLPDPPDKIKLEIPVFIGTVT